MIVDIIYVFKRLMGDTLPQQEGIETLQAPYAGTEGRWIVQHVTAGKFPCRVSSTGKIGSMIEGLALN